MPIKTHPFSNEEVMAYLDGELAAEVAAELKAHLAQCRACQELAADLQGVSRQLAGWSVEPFGGGVPEAVVQSLTEREAKKWKPTAHWRHILRKGWVAAAVAALFFAVILLKDEKVEFSKRAATAPLPASMNEFTRLERYANLQRPPSAAVPLVERNAELNLTAGHFDSVRTDLDQILLQFGGHIAQLNISSPAEQARRLTASLQVPSTRLDAALAELRKLGRVDGESMRGEEVTQQSVDLEARLKNLRHSEERLTQILATRTGKLTDVLEVEQKIAEVRGQIEQGEAEQKSLNNRVSFATVSLTVGEDYRAPLAAASAPATTTRIRNAAVRGLHNVYNVLLGLLLVILRAGPSILVFGALLGLPGYFLWKHLRQR